MRLLPVLACASLLVACGEKAAPAKAPPTVHVPNAPISPPRVEIVQPRRGKRTIHIRSSWAFNNGNGVWQQGNSEHNIELDE